MPALAAGELIVIGLGLFLVLWLYAAQTTLKSLADAIGDHVPLIGGKIRGAINAIVNGALEPVRRWIQAHLKPLVAWFAALATILVDFPGEVRRFARSVVNQLDHYAHVAAHDLIKAFLRPILRRLVAAEAVLNQLPRTLASLEKRVWRGIDDLKDWVQSAVLERALRGIDRLRHDTMEVAIPGLKDFVLDRIRDLRGEIATVEHGVENVAGNLRDLAKRLDIPLEVLETLIAAIGVTAAIEAVETLGTCRGKLKTLCTSDPNTWANFIAGLALLAAWPGLRELTEEAAALLEVEADFLRSTIVG